MDNNENALQKISGFLTGFAGRVIVIALLVLACAYGLKTSYDFGHDIFYQEPVEAEPGQDKNIKIGQDETLDSVASLLKDEGLIRNEIAFKVQGILYEVDINPGEYILNTSMTTKEILEKFMEAPEETVPQETEAQDVIGGGDESIGADQVEAAQREGIDIEAETAGETEGETAGDTEDDGAEESLSE